MKTNLLGTFIAAALAATSAFAQHSTLLKADVPFDFTAARKTLPAGQYMVERDSAAGLITIRSVDGRNAAMAITTGESSIVARQTGTLVFHRYGRKYFLSEVWTPGYDGRRLFPTRQEHEAASLTPPGKVTIAALR
jgi:hypothetical protein